MSEPLSAETVRHVAKLGQLDLSEEEVELYSRQLGDVLGHVAQIESLDLSGVPPVTHTLGETNVLRDDEIRPCLDRDTVLAQAPSAVDGRFRVPRILGEEP